MAPPYHARTLQRVDIVIVLRSTVLKSSGNALPRVARAVLLTVRGTVAFAHHLIRARLACAEGATVAVLKGNQLVALTAIPTGIAKRAVLQMSMYKFITNV
jgi:hypothetical protein